MVEVFCGFEFVCFCEDHLDVDVVPFASFEEEKVVAFEAVFDVDAEENLAETG